MLFGILSQRFKIHHNSKTIWCEMPISFSILNGTFSITKFYYSEGY